MRNLFLALLLSNLLILGWYGWVEAPTASPADPGSAQGLGLFRTDQAATTSANRDSAGHIQGAGAGCVRVGPWADDAAMQSAAALLAARGIAATPKAAEARIWLGYWVRIDDLGTVEAGESARRRLLAGGLADALLVQEESQSLISLGVFRDRARAEGIASRARELGFSPSIRDRFRPGGQLWLLLRPRQGQSLRPGDLRLGEDLILRSEPAPCDPLTEAAGSPEGG